MDETTQLRQRIHREGFDTEKVEGHWQVRDKEGKIIRHKSGKPLRFASSPSDSHSVKNAVSQLRDAGVLPPATKAKAKTNGSTTKQKLPRNVLKQYSATLRVELIQLMKQYGFSQAHISHFADYWAGQHNLHAPTFGQGVISKFLRGTALGNENYVWLTAAVSAIRRAEGKIPSVDELLAGKVKTEVPEEPPNEPGASIEVVGESNMPPKLPQLALDTMQMIYKDEKDHDAIMVLVQDIARLEQQ